MDPTLMSIVIIVCAVGGAHLGMAIRKKLPEHHQSADTKEVVKLGAGLVATLTALVLGLLVSSAKDTLDTMNHELTQTGAKIILLDRNLANFGPETMEIRGHLRNHLAHTLKLIWPKEAPESALLQKAEDSHPLEKFQAGLRALAPQSDAQRQLQAQAQQLGHELALSRWLIVETAQHELPQAFLVVLLLWLTILYICYGLISPRNGTVRAVYFISALSIAGAVFLILEMNTPLTGIIRVSSAPLNKALVLIGR
jgi:hypothetical protein